MCYQPIYFLHKKAEEELLQIAGYEALLRHHDGRTPLQILDDARRANALTALELEIFKMAASQVLLHSPHLLFFNVTPEAFSDASFAVRARRVLQDAGVSPTRVCIEVPERSFHDPEKFGNSLTDWINLGFYIALDDFGSMGSTNLDAVLSAKPDYVKVDRIFINNIYREARKQKLLAGMVETFAISGIYPILEGIEDKRDLEWILSKGWDVGGQGYALMSPSVVLAS